MRSLTSMAELERLATDLPHPDRDAAAAAEARQGQLTKPPGSLGRLEELAIWLAAWQHRPIPRLDEVDILVFAGNHGIVAQGVSPYPQAVTGQMVGNFLAGGAAIHQLARLAEARLRVFPLNLDTPTGDTTEADALSEEEFLDAASQGYDSIEPGTDLVCIGEMGIGNTTAAACLAGALFGGDGAHWAGRGTGVDDDGLLRKIRAIDTALARSRSRPVPPLEAARRLGGRELAAMLGAALAARHRSVPILVDGFVATAAIAPLALLHPQGLAHAKLSHRSAEQGHQSLIRRLEMEPLLDLRMHLGEASGAATALLIARAAVACHAGMATFAEAAVSNRT